jgi:hypothetical protein
LPRKSRHTCKVYELTGKVAAIAEIIEGIKKGNPPMSSTGMSPSGESSQNNTPGYGISGEYETHGQWFFSMGNRIQNGFLPHTTIGSKPTQSAPLDLPDEKYLVTPIAFAVNLEKELLIVVTKPGGITPEQIIKLLSNNKVKADRKLQLLPSKQERDKLLKRTKSLYLRYKFHDPHTGVKIFGLTGQQENVRAGLFEVTCEFKPLMSSAYADMSGMTPDPGVINLEAHDGEYTQCEVTVIDDEGEERTFDLFNQFMSCSGEILAIGRDISFKHYVDFLNSAIRALRL